MREEEKELEKKRRERRVGIKGKEEKRKKGIEERREGKEIKGRRKGIREEKIREEGKEGREGKGRTEKGKGKESLYLSLSYPSLPSFPPSPLPSFLPS